MDSYAVVKRHRQQVLDLAAEYRALDEGCFRTRHGLARKITLEVAAHGRLVHEASRQAGSMEGLALARAFLSIANEASAHEGFAGQEALFGPWLETVQGHLEAEPILLASVTARYARVEGKRLAAAG